MWDLPGAGLEPVSSALAGGFLTTAPPGKPNITFMWNLKCDTNEPIYETETDSQT